jgi:hypothetical protein
MGQVSGDDQMTKLFEIHEHLDMHSPSICLGEFKPTGWLSTKWGIIYACECGVFYRYVSREFFPIENTCRSEDRTAEVEELIAKTKPEFVKLWKEYCEAMLNMPMYSFNTQTAVFKLNGREAVESGVASRRTQ